MKIHLIAIGGSIMHNMAIALHKKGYSLTGSDDAIYEPAKSRLEKYGLLPESGWYPEKITQELDFVILGMHAKPDNPELLKAMELGLPIMSFPEFIFQQSQDKMRVVIAGSHGKTTVTSMVMHALSKAAYNFDYAVGSSIAGFEDSVKLTEDAPVIIIEGDEYLSSPIDRRPKFMWYHPQIALINGIAWDHINVFPTYEIYKDQFKQLIEDMKPESRLVYYSGDMEVVSLVETYGYHLNLTPTRLPIYRIEEGRTSILLEGIWYPLQVFGEHNLQNLAGAQKICEFLGMQEKDFWIAMADFTGAGKRLEPVLNQKDMIIFRDFAHAPSKVKGSVDAVAAQYPDKNLVAILELHTFSSLNKDFIKQYAHTMDKAAEAVVYVDNYALQTKGSGAYTQEQIREAFERQDIRFLDQPEALLKSIENALDKNNVVLLMSSGNLGGLNMKQMLEQK